MKKSPKPENSLLTCQYKELIYYKAIDLQVAKLPFRGDFTVFSLAFMFVYLSSHVEGHWMNGLFLFEMQRETLMFLSF